MDPILIGAAGAALTQGVTFLYEQASEILRAWRERRRNAAAPPPEILEPPEGVTVGSADPFPDAPDRSVEDQLQELRELLEPVRAGSVPADSDAAKQAAAALREVLESVLRAPITFAGEAPRSPQLTDVEVVVQDVAGRVTGIRGQLQAEETRVRVRAGKVEAGGEVMAIDMTKG